jgi:hypothetical protein
MLSQSGGVINRQRRQSEYANGVPGPGNYKEVAIESIKKREPAMM